MYILLLLAGFQHDPILAGMGEKDQLDNLVKALLKESYAGLSPLDPGSTRAYKVEYSGLVELMELPIRAIHILEVLPLSPLVEKFLAENIKPYPPMFNGVLGNGSD